MRLRTSSILSATVLTAAVLASGAAQAVERLPWDADLRVTERQQESVTVAWNAHPDAMRYSVGIQPVEACGDIYQSESTESLTATFSGLVPDCTYRIHAVAVVTMTRPYLNPVVMTEVTTPLPDGYVHPEAPSNLRPELVDGEVAGFVWDPGAVAVDPARYRFYVDPVLLTDPFQTTTDTSLRGRDFDYFLPIIGAMEFSTVTVWVTTVDGVRNESGPSNEVVLSCRPERSLRGAACVPA